MARCATNYLTDKNIRELTPKKKRYTKVVGEPKELVIVINPSGIKKFKIVYGKNKNKNEIGLKEFREGIYSVTQARQEARKILSELDAGKSVAEYKLEKNTDFTFGEYYKKFLHIKEFASENKADTLKHIKFRHAKYTLNALGRLDVRSIKPTMLKEILDAIYNPRAEQTRISVIKKLIEELFAIFNIALEDQIITFNPAFNLKKYYPTNKTKNHPAIIDTTLLKQFIQDLKNDGNMNPNTKRALYLQILTANRPINTVSAKWADIDLENGFWHIPADDMKKGRAHTVALSSYAIKVLKEQYLFTSEFVYVFASASKSGHIVRDAICKAIKNLGYKDKYKDLATAHGFRATFKTFCSNNEIELLNLGVTEKVVETAMSHKEKNSIISSYERIRATNEALKKVLQWYGDFLNNIEPLF